MNNTQLRQHSSTPPERHHHHHHHEDGADKFKRQMKNEKRRWELMGKITFYVLIVLVVMTFAFLMWSYDIINTLLTLM